MDIKISISCDIHMSQITNLKKILPKDLKYGNKWLMQKVTTGQSAENVSTVCLGTVGQLRHSHAWGERKVVRTTEAEDVPLPSQCWAPWCVCLVMSPGINSTFSPNTNMDLWCGLRPSGEGPTGNGFSCTKNLENIYWQEGRGGLCGERTVISRRREVGQERQIE